MISRFFAWLGQIIGQFFAWLGDLLLTWFQALFQSIQGCIDWGVTLINDTASGLLTDLLSMLPSDSAATRSVSAGAQLFRSCWVVGDVFVPLSEGLALVTFYFGFYLTVKITMFIVRIILDLF